MLVFKHFCIVTLPLVTGKHYHFTHHFSRRSKAPTSFFFAVFCSFFPLTKKTKAKRKNVNPLCPKKIWHEEIPMKMSCKKNEERHLGKKHLETQTSEKILRPIPSMYDIYTYIYHKNQPNVGPNIPVPWILWERQKILQTFDWGFWGPMPRWSWPCRH